MSNNGRGLAKPGAGLERSGRLCPGFGLRRQPAPLPRDKRTADVRLSCQNGRYPKLSRLSPTMGALSIPLSPAIPVRQTNSRPPT